MKTLFAAAILLATAAVAAGAATLQATAGLGGVVKAGRWTLLAVSIQNTLHNTSLDNTADALDADLDVVWGDTHLRRRVSLTPGVQTAFELYLRTSDARGAIDVRLVAGGQNLAAIAVPVRTLSSCACCPMRRPPIALAARPPCLHATCRVHRAAMKWQTRSPGPLDVQGSHRIRTPRCARGSR